MVKSKNKPKVSIIITYYNLADYIEETVVSAINQTYKNLEIILVNDGSNEDKSIKKLEEIKNKYKNKIKFIDQKNSGVSTARNNGIKNSNGIYICCLDGDDKLDKKYIEETFNILSKNKNLGFVTTWVQEFGEKNNIWETSDYKPEGLLVENLVHISSLFKKRAWKKVGGYSNSFKGYEDWEFWIKIVSRGYRWTVIKKTLFLYRKRENSKVSIDNQDRTNLIKKIIKKNRKLYIKNIPKIVIYNDRKFKNETDKSESIIKEKDTYIRKLRINYNKKTNYTNNKISLLLGSPDISGGTYVIFQHALSLLNDGYDITIITENKFDKEKLEWLPEAKKLNFIDLESASKEYYGLCIATWWRTVFYLPKINASKFAYFVQSIESKFCTESQNLLREFIESTYDIPFYFITEAHWIQKYLKDNHNKNCKLVLNGIDKDCFNASGKILDNTRPNGTRILVEGALNVFFKQTEIAVEVAKKAGAKDIWLLTPTEIKNFPGASRTFSKIPLKQVGEIMRSCDIILKLSKIEGMFGPPLEMMHCGGTSVTFNVTGYDEYIKDGINGLVYQMNDFQNITKGLSKLIKDHNYLQKLKQNGLITAKKWPDWNESGKKFIAEITAIMKNKKIQSTSSIKTTIIFLEKIYSIKNDEINSIKKIFKLLLRRLYQKINLIN